MRSTPDVNFIKLFWPQFTQTFCKLDHLIGVSNICFCVVESSGLQKSVSKFMAKCFVRLTPANNIVIDSRKKLERSSQLLSAHCFICKHCIRLPQ